MITIVDYVKRQNKAGNDFYALILQGGIELVKSQDTGLPLRRRLPLLQPLTRISAED
jgi:hypothetical protein